MLCASVDDEQVRYVSLLLETKLTLPADRILPCRDQVSSQDGIAKTEPKFRTASEHRERPIHVAVRLLSVCPYRLCTI
jgi:hypothetical protein